MLGTLVSIRHRAVYSFSLTTSGSCLRRRRADQNNLRSWLPYARCLHEHSGVDTPWLSAGFPVRQIFLMKVRDDSATGSLVKRVKSNHLGDLTMCSHLEWFGSWGDQDVHGCITTASNLQFYGRILDSLSLNACGFAESMWRAMRWVIQSRLQC